MMPSGLDLLEPKSSNVNLIKPDEAKSGLDLLEPTPIAKAVDEPKAVSKPINVDAYNPTGLFDYSQAAIKPPAPIMKKKFVPI
jgi:hypothetical protein